MFSIPLATKMFQFTRFAFPITREYHAFSVMGYPIRTSPDRRLFAPPRSLSQLITSFIASESQGIRHTLLLTFFTCSCDLSRNKFAAVQPRFIASHLLGYSVNLLINSCIFFQYVKELLWFVVTGGKRMKKTYTVALSVTPHRGE